METQTFNNEFLSVNKCFIDLGMETMTMISSQVAVATDVLLEGTPSVPEEGRTAIKTYYREIQMGLDNLKSQVKKGMDLDWTAADEPLKMLEEMETICQETLNRTVILKKEARALVKQTTEPLPQETKKLFDFWFAAVGTGIEMSQICVNRNFGLAKKFTSEVLMADRADAQQSDLDYQVG